MAKSPLREIPSNCSCRTSIVAFALWHVAPSCWSHMACLRPYRSIWAKRNRSSSIWKVLHRRRWPNQYRFEKKYGPITPLAPKSAPNSYCLWMHCHPANLAWVGIVPFTAISLGPKMRFVTKDDFSAKIKVLGRIYGRLRGLHPLKFQKTFLSGVQIY